MKALQQIYTEAASKQNLHILQVLGQFFERILLTKNPELVMLLLQKHHVELFGSLRYVASATDKTSDFLEFLEKGYQPLPDQFEVAPHLKEAILLRQRAIFLFDFVMLQYINEENMAFVTSVRAFYSRIRSWSKSIFRLWNSCLPTTVSSRE